MKHFHCPVEDVDCPYFVYKKGSEYCLCSIGGDPYYECDDFYSAYGDDCDPKDYTDGEEE